MAAQVTSVPTPVQRIQHERFSTEQHGYELLDISLSLSGNMAVSGNHYKSRRTFIDLFLWRNSNSRDKLKLFYSKEFGRYSHYWPNRYVSFVEKNGSELLVTCFGDKITIIDTKHESQVLESCTVKGETACLAAREAEIFIGLCDSHTVIVFNNDLKEMKRIRLNGIEGNEFPCEFQVIKDAVFAKTARHFRAISIAESNSNCIITQYTDIIGTYNTTTARSITASERLGLVAVLWYAPKINRISVYSTNEKKPFLVFDVDSKVSIIRISDKDRMMITGAGETGEIKMYHLEQLFSFEGMKRTLAYKVSPYECEELRKYFGITEEELNERGVGNKSKEVSDEEKTMKRMQCLLTIIEEKGHLHPYNINDLTDAVSTLTNMMRVSYLKGPMEGYVLHGGLRNRYELERAESKLETAESKVKELQEKIEALHREMDQVKQNYKDQEQALGKKTKRAEEKLKKEATVSTKKMKISSGALESCDISRTSSATQSLIAKEPKALKEVLSQQKEGNAELQEAKEDVQPSQSKRDDRTLKQQQRDWFLFLKRNIAGNWKDLGRYLDISEDDLTCITEECKGYIGESIYQMLLGWRQKNGGGATREKLIEALKKLDRTDVAENLAAL